MPRRVSSRCRLRRERPVLVVHAGNRVDADGAAAPGRFPPDQVDVVRARLARLLAHLRPEVAVSAAAAGAAPLVLQDAPRARLAAPPALPSSPLIGNAPCG